MSRGLLPFKLNITVSFSFIRTLSAVATLAIVSASMLSAAPRADSHAPIGVMGDHTHKKGEWMASYRFMSMAMGANYSGSTKVTPAQIHANFMISPVSMDMDMHMLGVMYAPSDKLTLMAMINSLDISMDHLVRNGVTFTTAANGIGDTMVGGLWTIHQSMSDHVHLNLGVSLPTGDIDVRDATPLGANTLLPYPMRLGSGTFDLKPGITWNHHEDQWSFGAQAIATIRLDENNRNYTLGDRFDLSAWIAHPMGENFSVSARVSYANWGDIDGADSGLNPMMVPTARTDLRGGSEFSGLLGLNYSITSGALTGNRIALEYGKMLDRDLDGPQLGTDDFFTLGWQYAF
jgi:hypothetical protein